MLHASITREGGAANDLSTHGQTTALSDLLLCVYDRLTDWVLVQRRCQASWYVPLTAYRHKR